MSAVWEQYSFLINYSDKGEERWFKCFVAIVQEYVANLASSKFKQNCHTQKKTQIKQNILEIKKEE